MEIMGSSESEIIFKVWPAQDFFFNQRRSWSRVFTIFRTLDQSLQNVSFIFEIL